MNALRALPRTRRWARLTDGWSDRGTLTRLMACWITGSVAAHVTSRPELTLLPAAFAATAVAVVPPVELWWDLTPTATFLEGACAVFPPLPLRRWDAIRRRMPGEVDLDAQIGDPRLQPMRAVAPRVRSIRLRPQTPITGRLALAS